METATKKKTPSDTTDFEREQLRFFLSRENVAEKLSELNPSLAWLPELARMNVIQSPVQLAPWIEKNFDDPEAVREVARNLAFFDERAADFLELGLNRKRANLPTLLTKSWQLIIRHIRDNPRGALRSEWFDLQPRIRAGEHSVEVFERLARVLRPRPKISKRIDWHREDEEGPREPKRPSDLMTVDYEVEGEITEKEVLDALPKDASAEIEQKLLTELSDALDAALEDALEAETETNSGYSVSDVDVPSVAKHHQNQYRSGFLPIVRVIAEIWTRLAHKDASLAVPFVKRWSASEHKLDKRIASFAAADKVVPPGIAADVLLELPQLLLFLTGASVEVFRLIRARWGQFPASKRNKIENRIAEGPAVTDFRSDADHHIDRCRFNVLGEMERSGLKLSDQSRALLADIRRKYPEWGLRPTEQAGFHIWHGGGGRFVGNSNKLQSVPPDSLIDEAKKLADKADFMSGDDWQALCQEKPQLALNGLASKAQNGNWPDWAWNPFLWAAQKLEAPDDVLLTGRLLLAFPDKDFLQVVSTASWWLNQKSKALGDDLLWPLWDKIEAAVAEEPRAETTMRDAMTEALNAPGGHLAEVLIKHITKGENGQEMPEPMKERFDLLASNVGRTGELARVRFAAELSLLFERAPDWTTERLVPSFDWKSSDAYNAWGARKYSNYIGSPKLFELTKASFLELFTRPEMTEDDLDTYAEWLTIIVIANRSEDAGYPITSGEARSVLRAAGPRALSSVGHRLATEMEAAKPEEKLEKWRGVVGPVFQSIWPLDADLQSPRVTFKLVQILRSSGSAFSEAADVITPFIRAEDPRHHTSVYSISGADEILYSSAPEKMLDLVSAVVGDAPPRTFYGLSSALDRILKYAPRLAATRKFQKLVTSAATI